MTIQLSKFWTATNFRAGGFEARHWRINPHDKITIGLSIHKIRNVKSTFTSPLPEDITSISVPLFTRTYAPYIRSIHVYVYTALIAPTQAAPRHATKILLFPYCTASCLSLVAERARCIPMFNY